VFADRFAKPAQDRLGHRVVDDFQLLKAAGASVGYHAIGNKVVEINVKQPDMEVQLVVLSDHSDYGIIPLVVELERRSEYPGHNSIV
jgi:hypothetical protein